MRPGERIYNPATDKQWSSEVYHKAKEVIETKLSVANGVVQYSSICETVKQQYPSLCDDTIKDPGNPQLPYWKHLVATAIQALKKGGKVDKADNGWIWGGVKLPSPPPAPTQPRLTHDELIQRIRNIGEMLGKRAEGPWGPVYKHDCIWRDNPYANPRLVWEVCDKGNLDKDIASLIWAVKNWNAKCILVVFDEPDFYTAQKKLAQESQICPLKAEDILKLHSLVQTRGAQAIKSIFTP
jgi:hypothetical protein